MAESKLSPGERAERDRCIASAIAEGRIGEDRRATYEEAWAENPVTARRLLTASAEAGGLVSVAAACVPVASTGWFSEEKLGGAA